MTLHERFDRLDTLLGQLREFWQFSPFHYTSAYFADKAPALQAALDALTIDDIDRLDADSATLSAFLQPHIPAASELEALCVLPALAAQQKLTARSAPGLSERKQQQIHDFIAVLPSYPLPLLEWCAGKGHLARTLARHTTQPVEGIELQAELCASGTQLAQAEGISLILHQQDALCPTAQRFFRPELHAVGLHACGELHMQLLRHGIHAACEAMTISPCCYHKISAEHYQPMSQVANQSTLQLSRHDLRLSLQESVTGGERIRRLRRLEVSYRLGFDALQRMVRGVDEYLNLPNLPKALLGEGFAAFCHWAADKRGVTLPQQVDWSHWEAIGEQRYLCVSRTELVRHLFRRPLEIWLVLDRALYLQEHGYQVHLGTFCERHLTPRNVMIHARRAPHSCVSDSLIVNSRTHE